MASSPDTDPTPQLLELEISPARPRVTAYVLGVLLIAIIGSSIAMLFLIRHSKYMFRLSSIHGVHSTFSVSASVIAAAIGVIFGLWGLKCLISGNARRLRLIYEFSASAVELAAALAEGEESRSLAIENLSDYEKALVQLGAYQQALQVSRLIVLSGGRAHINRPRYRRYPGEDLFRNDG
jgi:hypothetical protein